MEMAAAEAAEAATTTPQASPALTGRAKVCVQYVGLLGFFLPYQLGGLKFPQNLVCYECSTARQHYAAECPARLVRVRGEPTQGWRMDGVWWRRSKDPSAWHGAELTDAARAQFLTFVNKLS